MAAKTALNSNAYCLRLNDDSLNRIFTHLSLLELCAIRSTCTRFRSLATFHFKRFLRSKPMEIEIDVVSTMLKEVTVVKCFGQYIETLHINGTFAPEMNISVLKLITAHCNQHNLKHMRLQYFNFDELSLLKIKSIASSLEKIELHYCKFDGKSGADTTQLEMLLNNSKHLKQISIIFSHSSIEFGAKFLKAKHTRLEKLQIVGASIIDEHLLCDFFKFHPKLKHFTYNHMAGTIDDNVAVWLHYASKHAIWIEDICIRLHNFHAEHLMSLYQRKTLRRVVLNCLDFNNPIEPFINGLYEYNHAALELFGLWDTIFTEDLCIALAKLTNLKTLELQRLRNYFKCSNATKTLSKNLKNLEELYLDYTSVGTASDIYPFIDNCKKLKMISLSKMKYTKFFVNTDEIAVLIAKRATTASDVVFNANGSQVPLIIRINEGFHKEAKAMFMPFNKVLSFISFPNAMHENESVMIN